MNRRTNFNFSPKSNVFNQRHHVPQVRQKGQNGPLSRAKKPRANIQARPRGFAKPHQTNKKPKFSPRQEERFARAPVLKKYNPPLPSPSPIVKTTTR